MKVHKIGDLISQAADHLAIKVSHQTVTGYVNNFNRMISETLLDNWQIEIPKLARKLENLAPATRAKAFRHTKWFFRWLAIWHDFDPRAAEIVPHIRLVKSMPAIRSGEDIREALAAALARNRQLYSILALLALTGIRSAEAFKITRGEIDLKSGQIHLRNTPIRQLKTPRAARSLPISGALFPILATWISENRIIRPDRRLFTWNKFDGRHAKLPGGIQPRDLRKAFASALVDGVAECGAIQVKVDPVPAWRVSVLMGHSQVDTLAYYYGQSSGVPGLDPDDFR